MKTTLAFTVLGLAVAIFVVGARDDLTSKVVGFKNRTSSILRSDTYRFGDLFGMSYLPEFRIPLKKTSKIQRYQCRFRNGIHLYALCDSYLWNYVSTDSLYCGVERFQFATLNQRNQVFAHLDSNKTNILLLEMAERSVRPALLDNYITSFLVPVNEQLGESNRLPSKFNLKKLLFDSKYSKKINRNIEAILWETSIFTPLKTFKAGLNYKLLDRIDEQVVISRDKRYLFYKPTIDSAFLTSSFKAISDKELDNLIGKLNSAYEYYRSIGFDEVYLSIIPNPVTIMEPEYNRQRHNQLLLKIENSEKLKMPVMSVLSEFQGSNVELYEKSDSHWNMTGAFLWLNKFNRLLEGFHALSRKDNPGDFNQPAI
jgi:hypothetical protein